MRARGRERGSGNRQPGRAANPRVQLHSMGHARDLFRSSHCCASRVQQPYFHRPRGVGKQRRKRKREEPQLQPATAAALHVATVLHFQAGRLRL